jgi:hypothetical protein
VRSFHSNIVRWKPYASSLKSGTKSSNYVHFLWILCTKYTYKLNDILNTWWKTIWSEVQNHFKKRRSVMKSGENNMCKHLPLNWVAWKPKVPHNGQSFSISKALKIKSTHVSIWTALILFFQQCVNFLWLHMRWVGMKTSLIVTQLTIFNSTDHKEKRRNGAYFLSYK